MIVVAWAPACGMLATLVLWADLKRVPWRRIWAGYRLQLAKGDRPFWLMLATVAAFEYATGMIGQ